MKYLPMICLPSSPEGQGYVAVPGPSLNSPSLNFLCDMLKWNEDMLCERYEVNGIKIDTK
jgi:hypothetical protein